MKVLAFDPDSTNTGWAHVELTIEGEVNLLAAGVIQSSKKLIGDDGLRAHLKAIREAAPELPSDYDILAVETQYKMGSGKGADSIILIANVSGALFNLNPEKAVRVSPLLWTKGWGKGGDDEGRQSIILRAFKTTTAKVAELVGCKPSDANHTIDGMGIGRWLCLNWSKAAWKNRDVSKPRKKSTARKFGSSNYPRKN